MECIKLILVMTKAEPSQNIDGTVLYATVKGAERLNATFCNKKSSYFKWVSRIVDCYNANAFKIQITAK